MIEVRDLVKAYGRRRAVDEVSFTAWPGRVLALLGPNGAGKSTTIRALVGLLRPDAGRVRVAGVDALADPVAAKAKVGFVPDRPYLYGKLTGRELLRFLGRVRRVPEFEGRADALLARFGLTAKQNERVETFSHGMRQKLTFCAALLHDPPVLIVDEPMVGLDPRSARDVRSLFRERADAGGTVLVTTHSLDVAEAVADTVVVLHHGRVAAEGGMDALRARVGRADADLEAIFLQLTEDAGGGAGAAA